MACRYCGANKGEIWVYQVEDTVVEVCKTCKILLNPAPVVSLLKVERR